MAARSRRRLLHEDRVPDSESDEDERVVNDSLPNTGPIELSDEEDNATSPSRAHTPQPVPGARQPMEVLLNSRGVRPRAEWLESCLNEFAISHPGFAGLPVASQAELCFGQFMMADFNVAGAACLPPAIHTLHGTELPGPFVLQVDEVIDIRHSLRERYQEKKAGSGRTLKLSITDGVQRVSGLEYRPIAALQVLCPAGIKISLKNVCVRRGLLMLVPEVLEILGGSVEHLETARLRAVEVINKPPRGRRTRQGVPEPSLAETATRAAWSTNSQGSVTSAENSDRRQHPVSQAVSNNAQDLSGTRPSHPISDSTVRHPPREDAQQEAEGTDRQYHQPVQSSGQQSAQGSHFQHPTRATFVHQEATIRSMEQDLPAQPAQTSWQSAQVSQVQHSFRSASVQQGVQRQPMQQDRFTNPGEQPFRVSGPHSVGLERQQAGNLQESVEQHQEVHVNGMNVTGVPQSPLGYMHQVDQHHVVQQGGRDGGPRRESMTTNSVQESTSIQVSAVGIGPRQPTPAIGRLSLPRRLVQSKLPIKPQPQVVVEQPVQRNDDADVMTPIDLDDSQESGQNTPATGSNTSERVDIFSDTVPFTYLSVLKDRSNFQLEQRGLVRGKVKCVITGVIHFQYKDADEFKLHIHIEDGSLITSASVQHQLVQRLVGYSPREVITGLKDPHTHKEMLDNMIRFQKLLERFEGLMEVEFSNTTSLPTVLQITEGIQDADVRSLYDRVHLSRSMQTPNSNSIPTIDLSTP